MKHFLLLNTLILSFFAFSQDYYFTPKWKAGDKKTITVTTHQKEVKNNRTEEDTTTIQKILFEVLKEENGIYSLQTIFENPIITTSNQLYDKTKEKLPQYTDLKILSILNAETGKIEVQNAEEVNKFVQESIEEAKKILKKKAKIKENVADLMFLSTKTAYSEKTTIEDNLNKQLAFLFVPFYKKLYVNEKNTTIQEEQNPFKPESKINRITTTTLTSFDTQKIECQIQQKFEYDLKEFLETMKTFMASLMNAMDKSGEAAKSLDDMVMDMKNEYDVIYDYESTWVKSSISSIQVQVSIPGKTSKTAYYHSTAVVE